MSRKAKVCTIPIQKKLPKKKRDSNTPISAWTRGGTESGDMFLELQESSGIPSGKLHTKASHERCRNDILETFLKHGATFQFPPPLDRAKTIGSAFFGDDRDFKRRSERGDKPLG